jgi:hypothetical protein
MKKIKINYFDLGLHTANELFDMCIFLHENYFDHDWNTYGFEACGLYHDFCEERFKKSNPRVKIVHGAISNSENFMKLYYADNALGHSIFESKNEELDDNFVDFSEDKDAVPAVNIPLMFNYCFEDDSYEKIVPGLSLEKLYLWVKKWTSTLGARPVLLAKGKDGKHIEVDKTNIVPWFSDMFTLKAPSIPRPQYEYTKGIVFSKWLKENVPDFEDSFNILRVNIEGAEVHLFEDLIKNDLVKHFDMFCGTGNDVEKISEHSADKYYKMLDDSGIKMYRLTDWKPELNDPIGDIIAEKIEEWKTKNVLP